MAQSYEDVLRGEASGQVCKNLLGSASEALAIHGDDPKGMQILAAGFAAAIHEINNVLEPDFRRTVTELLKLRYP